MDRSELLRKFIFRERCFQIASGSLLLVLGCGLIAVFLFAGNPGQYGRTFLIPCCALLLPSIAKGIAFRVRCPFCRKPLERETGAMSTGRCPSCRNLIFADHPLSPEPYLLPHEGQKARRKKSVWINVVSLVIFIPFALFMAFMAVTMRDFAIAEPVFTIRMVVSLIGALLIYCGLSCILRPKSFLRGSARTFPCPVCKEAPILRQLTMTGNCSSCGVRLREDLPPPDPDGRPAPVDPARLKDYLRREKMLQLWLFGYLFLLLAAFAAAVKLYDSVWLVIAFIAIFSGVLPIGTLIDRRLRRQFPDIPPQCPGCLARKAEDAKLLFCSGPCEEWLQFDRCPQCGFRIIDKSDR